MVSASLYIRDLRKRGSPAHPGYSNTYGGYAKIVLLTFSCSAH
jgi:hypothetical protein